MTATISGPDTRLTFLDKYAEMASPVNTINRNTTTPQLNIHNANTPRTKRETLLENGDNPDTIV